MIKHFNQARGNGETGYTKGEKVTIKANLVGFIFFEKNIDEQTYDLVRKPDYMNTSPQVIMALLRQLVEKVGVEQKDISVGDTLALFPNQYYDIIRREFPDIHYLDRMGGSERHPRTGIENSSIPLYWSQRPSDTDQDYVPAPYAEAKYFINLANLKSHNMAGVTLCGKNHYGSLNRTPPQKGYFDIHNSLPRRTPGSGHYRALVDMLGHAHIGRQDAAELRRRALPGSASH